MNVRVGRTKRNDIHNFEGLFVNGGIYTGAVCPYYSGNLNIPMRWIIDSNILQSGDEGANETFSESIVLNIVRSGQAVVSFDLLAEDIH